MTIRCRLDGLLLSAVLTEHDSCLIAYDGNEPFGMEATEALHYELVRATAEEVLGLERAHYRLLRQATDFHFVPGEMHAGH